MRKIFSWKYLARVRYVNCTFECISNSRHKSEILPTPPFQLLHFYTGCAFIFLRIFFVCVLQIEHFGLYTKSSHRIQDFIGTSKPHLLVITYLLKLRDQKRSTKKIRADIYL